jgi:3-deoxy-manno-octulosonate cytidylyltransferase (CMP-KDO synthetase)
MTMSQFPTIIVPARLNSSRLERKLLYEINGKPLIIWTAERIKSEAPNFPLFFAVDSAELSECLKSFGFDSILTRADHPSGTDRIAEANEAIEAEWVINVQGDEPLILGSQIQMLADSFKEGHQMTTLASPFVQVEDFYNPNDVKVVRGLEGNALYFSRSPIPYARDLKGEVSTDWLLNNNCYKHIGLYGYSAEFLKSIVRMPRGNLESLESLEQLRILENGHSIYVGISNEETIGIDTIEDIESFKAYLAS